MTKPYFSIVTTTKNSQSTIIQTLNSVKIQTFKDYEHIVIDSFSDDKTYELIKNFNSKKIIKKQIKDNSCFEGLNNAFNFVNGKFIILLHSGDLLYSSQTLEKVKKNIDEKTDLLICNCIYYNKLNKIKRIWEINTKYLNLKNCYNIPHTATVMNTKLVKKIGDYKLDFKIASDTEYILRIFKNKKVNYVFLADFLCFMKLGGMSTSSKFVFKKVIEDLDIYLDYFGRVKFIFIYLKKIFIKFRQYMKLKDKEIHNKNLLLILKK